MPVLRKQNKHNNFVILDKHFLQDKTLSLKAKGLLSYLLSLPDNWEPKVSELVTHSTDGRDAIYSTITELKDAGYITTSQERSFHGKFSHHVYLVHEMPQKPPSETPPHSKKQALEPVSPIRGNPHTEKPYAVKPDTDNPSLISNNCNNNINKINTAAAVSTHRDTQSAQPQPAAAVNGFSLLEPVIGKRLTKTQLQAVSQTTQELGVFCQDSQFEQLKQEIEFSLLCPHEFTKAGKNFSKKLNTIKKCIRKGTWRPPAGLNARGQGSCATQSYCPDDLIKIVKAKTQRLELELQVEINALHSPMAGYPSFKAATHQRIDELSKQIEALKKQLPNSCGEQKNVI